MKELVTYKAPGIETESECKDPSGLSKRQLLFTISFPLLFLFCVLLTNIITGTLGPIVSSNLFYSTIVGFIVGLLVFIIFIPKVLRIPRRITLRDYLNTIGVNRIRPVSRTLLIFIPCFIIIMVSQVIASLTYNQFILGWEFNQFTNQLLNHSRIVNEIGLSVLYSFGCIFEEVVLRGVILTMFLKIYSKRMAILGSAILFGYGHLLNLLNGPFAYELVIFVCAQIIWTTIHGVLYGYMFLITGNLYANMLLHLSVNGMGNCFMYLPYASPETHAVLNIVFNLGLISTLISFGWIFLIAKYWPLKVENRPNPPVKMSALN